MRCNPLAARPTTKGLYGKPRVNDGKCKVLHIGKDNPKNAYFMNGLQLPEINLRPSTRLGDPPLRGV